MNLKILFNNIKNIRIFLHNTSISLVKIKICKKKYARTAIGLCCTYFFRRHLRPAALAAPLFDLGEAINNENTFTLETGGGGREIERLKDVKYIRRIRIKKQIKE